MGLESSCLFFNVDVVYEFMQQSYVMINFFTFLVRQRLGREGGGEQHQYLSWK